MVQLLDLDVEAHRTILEQLPVHHLSALSGTCRHFRSCVLEGRFAEKLWRDRCQQQLGKGFLKLHQAGLPHHLAPTARYWQHLWYSADSMDHVRWWKGGSDIINNSADQADARALEAGDVPGPPMKARLARSGHLSSVIGHLMVVSGGILRDGSLCMDLVIMDLADLTFIKPEVYGVVAMTRFRHTGVIVAPDLSSTVQQTVNQLLHPAKRDASQGSVILLFGGYNTMGQEFGGDDFEALWVAHDGSAVAWVSIKSQGHAPSKRFHHTTTLFNGGKQVILYGGEGHELIDGAGEQPPNVYTFDIASLTWHRNSTTCTTPDGSPGVRSLHIATVRENPETGHEELIVLAGYCSDVLATMHPHRLDLVTWQWFREPGLVPNPGPRDATSLPIPRQRAAGEVVGKKWVLMHAGSPTQFLQGNFLDDLQKLHLPSLTWRQPPTLHGRPAPGLRNIAGHSLEGLIAFGGCIPTIMGIMPVAKTDPLLIGPTPRLDLLLERDPATSICSLPPLHPPGPLGAPPPAAAPQAHADLPGLGAVHPPADILPHPSGATVADLTQPEHQFQPQAWRPKIEPHLYLLDILERAPHGLQTDSANQAASSSALGVAEERGHVVQGSTPVHPSAVGGPGMQPAAAYLAAGVRRPGDTLPHPPPDILPHPSGATVSDLTRPEHQFQPQPWRPDLEARLRGLERMGGGSLHAVASLRASGNQAASPSALRVADALRVAEGHGHVGHSSTPVRPLAWGGAGPQPAAAAAAAASASAAYTAATDAHRMAPPQDMRNQRPRRPATAADARWSNVPGVAQLQTNSPRVEWWPATTSEHVPEQHLGAESSLHPFTAAAPSSGARPAQSTSTPGQATDHPPSGRPGVLDSSPAIANQGFVPWRPPVMWHDSQPGEAQAAPTTYWRHAVTGEFYIRQENEHGESVMVLAEVASSDSSDSGGSPTGVAAFQPEEDLNQLPPNGQSQNQGPCLMQ